MVIHCRVHSRLTATSRLAVDKFTMVSICCTSVGSKRLLLSVCRSFSEQFRNCCLPLSTSSRFVGPLHAEGYVESNEGDRIFKWMSRERYRLFAHDCANSPSVLYNVWFVLGCLSEWRRLPVTVIRSCHRHWFSLFSRPDEVKAGGHRN